MTVTLSYLAPYTHAPTQIEQHNKPRNTIIATILAGAAGDTQQVVTHAFGLTAAQITQGYPVVTFTPLDGNSITSPWFLQSSGPNHVVLAKSSTAAGALTEVAIARTIGTPVQ